MSVYTLPNRPVTNNLTALAGGASIGATQLSLGWNEVDTVVTTGDSVALPQAIQGADCLVNNQNTAAGTTVKIVGQANSLNGGAVDSIIAHGSVALVAGGTGVTLATGHVSQFICTTMGQWKQMSDLA